MTIQPKSVISLKINIECIPSERIGDRYRWPCEHYCEVVFNNKEGADYVRLFRKEVAALVREIDPSRVSYHINGVETRSIPHKNEISVQPASRILTDIFYRLG